MAAATLDVHGVAQRKPLGMSLALIQHGRVYSWLTPLPPLQQIIESVCRKAFVMGAASNLTLPARAHARAGAFLHHDLTPDMRACRAGCQGSSHCHANGAALHQLASHRYVLPITKRYHPDTKPRMNHACSIQPCWQPGNA